VSNSVTHITSGGLIGIAFIERADAKGHKAGELMMKSLQGTWPQIQGVQGFQWLQCFQERGPLVAVGWDR